MIPIRLAVEGLYSYQQRQEVNFRPLIDSGLFGIFGQVGSGKTSLLEAISFVLYGRTERLNAKTDNRAYNMMNLRTGQMRIEFEFRAGADNDEYRYEFKAKRNKKQHHEVNTGERSVYRRDGAEWVPQSIEKTDIGHFTQSVLGLDYDNFKRTVIIPQNQFREFLELSPTDRTQMMSHLFDLTRFDLAGPTAALDKTNQTELDTLSGQLSGLESATVESVETARIAIRDMNSIVEQQNDQLLILETERSQLQHLRERHDKLAEAQADLAQLTIEKPAYEQLEQQLDQYEQTDRIFRTLLTQLAQLTDRQQRLLKQAQPIAARLSEIQHQLPALRQASETTRLSFKNRHQLREQIDELGVVRLIRSNQKNIEREVLRLKKLQDQANRQALQIQQKTTERDQEQALASTLGQQVSRLEELRDIQRWFDRDNALRETMGKGEEKIRTNEASRDAIKQRKDDALRGFADDWADRQLKELPALIEEAIQALKTIQEERKATHDDNLLKQRLQQFADALADGKACPLCGSEHHPAVHQDSNIDEAVQKSGQALKKVNTRLDELVALLTQIRELYVELKTVIGQGKDLINDQHNAVKDRADHTGLFVWTGFLPTQEAALTDAIRQQTSNHNRLTVIQKDIDRLTKELEAARLDQGRTESSLAAGLVSQASLEQLVTDQLAQLNHIKPAEVVAFDLAQIDAMVYELEKQFAQTETDYDRADRALTDAENQVIRSQADLEQLASQQADCQQEQAALNGTLADALAQQQLTRQEVETILKTNLDPTVSRHQIRDFTVRLTIAQTKTDDLTTELAHQPFDPAELAQVQADCQTAKAAYHTAHQQLGERTEAYAKLRDQWLQKQALQQRFDELSLRRDDLKELKDLFRGQGFAKYVSTVRLNELCQAANDRFSQLTNNQLRLEFADDNFVIRDFLNGGKTRLAKTLSGGQMFQAALSLALALSDNIQHLTQSKQNLFFLDEGFGTLDKAALQTVFETLKSLRRENRIVGIISHVEELQQEFDTYIRTINTDSGSRIECSWEIQ